MRRFVWLATVIVLAGCTIRTKEPMKEMPKFGSTPRLSTTAGFVEGRWRLFLDESTARYHMPEMAKNMLATMAEELILTADGKAEFLLEGHTAHGHWKEHGNGINLTFDDADGVAPVEIRAKYDRFIEGSRFYRDGHGGDYVRWVTFDLATKTDRLELHEDRKRLFQPPANANSDGTTFMGIHTWLRE